MPSRHSSRRIATFAAAGATALTLFAVPSAQAAGTGPLAQADAPVNRVERTPDPMKSNEGSSPQRRADPPNNPPPSSGGTPMPMSEKERQMGSAEGARPQIDSRAPPARREGAMENPDRATTPAPGGSADGLPRVGGPAPRNDSQTDRPRDRPNG